MARGYGIKKIVGMRFSNWLPLLFCLLFFGCTSEPKPKGVINYEGETTEFDWVTFNANKDLWTKKNTGNYNMILNDTDRTLITIEVRDGRAVSAKRSDNFYRSVMEQHSSYNTVEKIFAIVEVEARKKRKLFVRFGTEGYPQLVESKDPAGREKQLTINVAGVFIKD